MSSMTAIDFHTSIATRFNEKYAGHSNFKERFQIWAAMIDRYSRPDFRVLDVGCGSGVFAFHLAERCQNVIGIDGSDEMIRICREKSAAVSCDRLRFVQGRIDAMQDHVQEPVDMIVCSSVLEYLDDLPGSLRHIAGFLKPGGLFLFSLPNKRSLLRRIEPIAFRTVGRPAYYKYVKNVCTFEEIQAPLRNCGLEVIDHAYFGATPVLSTLLRPIGGERYFNNLFLAVARLEQPGQIAGRPAREAA